MEKKSYHRKDLKHTLLEKGIEIVSEQGVHDFSLRKLAAACEVSHGAPYSHYHNKEEFMKAMQEYITDQFSEELEQTIRKYKEDPDCLLYLGKAYLRFFLRHPAYYSFLYTRAEIRIDLDQMGEIPDNYRPFEIYKHAVLAHVSGMVAQKAKDLVIAMWAYVHGITAIATMKGTEYAENWEEKVTDYLRMLQC